MLNSDSDSTQKSVNKKFVAFVKEKTGRNLKCNVCSLHLGKNFETYLVGTSSTPGIVSKDTCKLLHIIGSLLSPVREKYRQIELHEEWKDFQKEHNFQCDPFIKEKTSRNIDI